MKWNFNDQTLTLDSIHIADEVVRNLTCPIARNQYGTHISKLIAYFMVGIIFRSIIKIKKKVLFLLTVKYRIH